MPGYADWKSLYSDEYIQLRDEGYQIGGKLSPQSMRSNIGRDLSAAEWEEAYHRLWKQREKGLRPDYPFAEPDGYDEIIRDAADLPELIRIDEERYAEKIRGAWHGRCAGVVLGKPLETDVSRLDIEKYLKSVNAYPLACWVPAYSEALDKRTGCHSSTKGNISFVEDDDDTRYTILALNLVEKKGLNFTHHDVLKNFVDNVPYALLWSATKQAVFHYMNMSEGRPCEEQIKEFATKINPMREGINGTIRADFWGYIAPGDPRRAARLAHREASVNMVKNGLYGSMFTAACISAALTRNPSVDTILQGGLSVIPQKSRLANVVKEVRDWYGIDRDWTVTCDRIYEKYGHMSFAGGLNNLAICVLALLHGNLDYTKTITTAVMCGIDTDCNGGTTGSIVGAAVGFDRIDPKWVEPFHDTIRTTAACYTIGSISELVQRTVLAYQKTKAE